MRTNRTRNMTLRLTQRSSDNHVRAPVPRADAPGTAPTRAKDVLHRLTHMLFASIVNNKDNKPTVTSLLFHLYFTTLYNVKLLVARQAQTPIVPNGSTAQTPAAYTNVRADIQRLLSAEPDFDQPLLAQLLFVAHQAFCTARYPGALYPHANMHMCDIAAREYAIPAPWTDLVATWAAEQARGLDAVMPNALLGPALTQHVRADATGATNGDNPSPLHWQPLQPPTGAATNDQQVPIVDPSNPATF